MKHQRILRPAVLAVAAALAVVSGCDPSNNQPPKPAGSDPAAVPGRAAGPDANPAAAAAANAAQSTPPAGQQAAATAAMPVPGSERAFVAEAAMSGLAEAEAGRLAAEKTTNADVKSFAQQLERDHVSNGDELKRIAGIKGIDLPSAIDGEQKARLDKLRALSAADFDRAFLQDFGVDAHRQAIALFERQAREGRDAELQAYAERTLPKLREHLAMGQQLQGKTPGS